MRVFIVIVSVLLLFISCQRDIELDLPEHESKLVLNGMMVHDSIFQCYITRSIAPLKSGELLPVTNAQVIITSSAGQTETLVHYGNGLYKAASVKGLSGLSFDIKAAAEGYNVISSEALIPEMVYFDSVKTSLVRQDEYGDSYNVKLYFKDNPDKANYYLMEMYSIDSAGHKEVYYFEYKSNNDNENVGYVNNGIMFDDNMFNGLLVTKEMNFYDNAGLIYDSLGTPSKVPSNKKYFVALSNLSKDAYLYYKSRAEQMNNGSNPFAEPTLVYSNIKGGMGIFAGYAASAKQVK